MPNELDIELDDFNHIYTLGGIQVPGCTSVLAAMGASKGFGFLTPAEREFYQSRGHAGHKAIELLIRGELDRRTVVNEIKGYLKSWEIGVKEYEIEPLVVDGQPFVERILCHQTFRYGVKPDVGALVRGVPSLIELKLTSAHAPATEIQLACQFLAAKPLIPDLKNKYAFRLIPNERPDVRKYSDPSAEGVWLSLLNGYNWRAKNKLL